MLANPLTYGVEALRQLLFPGTPGVASLSASLATLLLFSLVHVRLGFRYGQPQDDQTRRMTQVPEQYAIFPVINATLNGTSGVLLFIGRSFIKRGQHGGASQFHDCALYQLDPIFDFVFVLSHFTTFMVALVRHFQGQGWARPVYFTILISHTILAVDDCSACDHYIESRVAFAL